MKFVPMIIALLSFSPLTYSIEIIIYRWVDSNNVVHFSQNQPVHNNFTEIPMQNFKHNTSKSNPPSRGNFSANENKDSLTLKEKEEKCLIAKNNLATLEKFELIQYKTNLSETKILTEKEKKDQLALNKQQVDLFCGD